MNIFRLFILLFITSFCVVHSENLPTYRMVDLGLFETDSSYAYSINEKGQILGTFQENNRSYFFIWDEINGIKFIEPPEHHIFSSMMLNNEGQIAGKMLLPSSNTQTIFYWDINLGFWEIESGITNCFIYGFNDKGQILGVLNGQIILWDHGKKINLSSLFYSQIPGEWSSLHSPRLNNFGHVALLAYDQKLEQNRLFIWNGLFNHIALHDKRLNDNRLDSILFLDDENNMVLNLMDSSHQRFNFFISLSNHFFASCCECGSIRSSLPLSVGCLPSLLKKDRQGDFYFLKGVEIRRLIQERPPYYISNMLIRDQNSKGYVVGSLDTLYGHHAFLAIPEFERD